MASAAFRSTTKRTPIGKSSSSESSVHRRSRSLSRFSRRFPDPYEEDISDEAPSAPRAKFTNRLRGPGFPEVSLDDLAVHFFDSTDRGRLASRNGDVSSGERASSSQRRGRSVSRQSSKVGEGKGSGGNNNNYSGGGRVNSEINNRRRRSVSLVRYQNSDSESEPDHHRNSNSHTNLKSFTNRNDQTVLSSRAVSSHYRQRQRRSLSQKDLNSCDNYSSQSTVLTDDEGKNANVMEKTIRAVYTVKKARGRTNTYGLANDDCYGSRSSDASQAVSTITKNFATQLEQSEQRKMDLLAEIVFEEQRGRELSKIMKDMLSNSSRTVVEKPSRSRKRSNDRSKISRQLIDEAEKYIEDFISNVEDTTDISSLDGERSDTTSSLGGITMTQTFQSPMKKHLPVDMEGVMLPWLKWDSSNEASSPSSFKKEVLATPKSQLRNAIKELTPTQNSTSSYDSWNPDSFGGFSTNFIEHARLDNTNGYCTHPKPDEIRSFQFDMEEYIRRPNEDEFLLERWWQLKKIHSGCFLLCNQLYF